jgi:hypothetical protein
MTEVMGLFASNLEGASFFCSKKFDVFKAYVPFVSGPLFKVFIFCFS